MVYLAPPLQSILDPPLYTGSQTFFYLLLEQLESFVQELAFLLQAYVDSSSLECIAMKGTVILQHLLLQKPSTNCKAKECAKHLQRRLELWLSGDVDVLLNEGLCIQKRLSSNRSFSKKDTLAQSFAKKDETRKGEWCPEFPLDEQRRGSFKPR